MPFNFPSSPTVGQEANGYKWDGEKWIVIGSDDPADDFLPLSGGVLTGPLTLAGAPTVNLHAATKKYVDDKGMISVKEFGAVGNGVVDDTAALNTWIAHISTNGLSGYLPPGTYRITAGLTPGIGSNWGIIGAGPYLSVISYQGVSTTSDILVAGNGVTRFVGAYFSNFRITSTTTMTAGAALRIRGYDGYAVDGVIFHHSNVTHATLFLWNGLYIDNSSYGSYVNADAATRNDAIVLRTVTGFFVDNVRSLFTGRFAFHIAGGCGGIYTGYLEIYGASIGIVVDNELDAANSNLQIFIGGHTIVDTCINNGIYLGDTVASAFKHFVMEGWAASSQNGSGANFQIVNWGGGIVTFTGAQIVSGQGSGINIVDATAKVFIDNTTVVANNVQTGIAGAAASSLFCDAIPFNNTAANFGANYRAGSGAYFAPWSQVTCALSANLGGPPTGSADVRYAIRGKTINFRARVNVISNAGASGALKIVLPSALVGMSGLAVGRDLNISGKMVAGSISGPHMDIVFFDNNYPGVNGVFIDLAGTFEAA